MDRPVRRRRSRLAYLAATATNSPLPNTPLGNGGKKHGRAHYITEGTNHEQKKSVDKADIVQQAIDYVATTDLVLKWDFPEADPPSPEIASLLKSFFDDGEIERTTSALLCDYLVNCLQEDYLLGDKPSQSGQDHAPVCRVVCDDDDE